MAGIDSIINTRADAFANNPQGLMQRYAMNQDLLDLLALQKLKQDKEAAQRSLQMQMQAPQNTVKDQLEGQVMDMTKQEVAQAVAPGLQQQGQRMQAEQMQQAMGAGLGGLQAPAGLGMAQGGIVGYAGGDGSYVSQDAYRRQEAKERAEKERRDNAALVASLEDAYRRQKAAQETAGLPYSSEAILQELLSRSAGTTPPESKAPIVGAMGENSIVPDISMDALRAADIRRSDAEKVASLEARAERGRNSRVWEGVARAAQEQGSSGAGVLSGLGNLIAKTQGNSIPESAPATQTEEPATQTEEVAQEYVTPAPKGPARTVAQAVETVKNYVKNAAGAAEQGGADLLTELEYRNALRVLNDNGISTEDLFRRPGKGFFNRDAGILGMGDSGLQDEAKRLENMLSTLNAYKEYGVPPPNNYPSEEEIQKRLRVVNTFMTPAASAQEPAPASVTSTPTAPTPVAPAPTPVAPAPTSTAPARAPTTTSKPRRAGFDLSELIGGQYVPEPAVEKPAEKPAEKYRSRYEDRLAEIEAEKNNRTSALIDFLLAAGASRGTNLGATLTGGGSGLRAREARLAGQEADVLKSIIEDEQAQQMMGFRERELAQQAEQNALTRSLQERIAAADRASQEGRTADEIASRRDIAEMQINEAVKRAEIAAGTAVTQAQIDALKDARTVLKDDQAYLTEIMNAQKQYKNDPTRLVTVMQAITDDYLDAYLSPVGLSTTKFEMTRPAPTK